MGCNYNSCCQDEKDNDQKKTTDVQVSTIDLTQGRGITTATLENRVTDQTFEEYEHSGQHIKVERVQITTVLKELDKKKEVENFQSFKDNHPKTGRFVAKDQQDEEQWMTFSRALIIHLWWCFSASGTFSLSLPSEYTKDDKNLKDAQVVSPGILFLPNWFESGAIFAYTGLTN